jgi:hypothetical protein
MSEMRSLLTLRDDGQVAFFHNGDRAQMRAAIWALKDELTKGEEVEFKTEHVLNDGTYTRILHIPKGSLLVGKIHLKDCVNLVSKGDISLLTEFGAKRVQAGFHGVSRAGIMKAGYAHEDTIFVNVFRTDKTDLEEIEAEIASESIDALLGMNEMEALCL